MLGGVLTVIKAGTNNHSWRARVKKTMTVLQGLARTHSQYGDKKLLYSYILCGYCYVDGHKERDPQRELSSDEKVELRMSRSYVSRAGHKLVYFLQETHTDVRGKACWDIGCATGGFTQVLLDRGASQVYAVDNAYNVLDYSLRIHKNVIVYERTNAMELPPLDHDPDIAVMDVSFRSIRGLVAKTLSRCKEKKAFVLCKPQFELQQSPYNYSQFDGVIRDNTIIRKVVDFVIEELADEGCRCTKTLMTPVHGNKGNKEVFLEVSLK